MAIVNSHTLVGLDRVGEKKALTLLEHFPSWVALADASLADLNDVVGEGLATTLFHALHNAQE
jgi:excinuclease UvrABC nuclease subunit